MKRLYNKNDVYNSHCYLIQYNDDYFRVVLNKYQREKGFEEVHMNKINNDEEEIERISLSRTKRNIKELCLCNNFEYFTTLTVNSMGDRYSLEDCQKQLHKLCDKLKRRNKNFKYLFITEKHKDGAFHFHGLTCGLDLYLNKNGYFSNSLFDRMGFNSFSKIKNYNKCCNYITKYITKDCVRNSHNQIYFCSKGLKKADKYEIPFIDIDWSFENDFCKIRDFSPSELSNNDILKFLSLNNPQKLQKNNNILGGFFYRM